MALFAARNNLNFPSGATPTINPSHIALANGQPRFSAVPWSKAGFMYTLFPIFKMGTKAGTITTVLDPTLGVCAHTTSSGTNNNTFTGQLGETATKSTLACIYRPTNFTAEAHFVCTSTSTTTGWDLGTATTGALKLLNGGFNGAATSTIILTAGHPYFVAASISTVGPGATGIHWVATDLSTGQIATQSGSISPLTATLSNGTYSIIGDSGAGESIAGNFAACMTTNIFMPMGELVKWAADPWSFWYPNNKAIILLSSLQPSSGAPPPGLQIYDVPTPQLRPDETHISFYNPTYMQTGAKPSGADFYDLPDTWTPPFRPDFTQVGFYNPTQMNTGKEPFFQTDWPVPLGARDPRQPERNWDWPSVATQRMVKPVGVQSWDLSPRQPPPRPDETWTFNYNPTEMNTGAKPAGAQSWDLSPRQVPVRPDETWTWNYNPTQMQTGQEPFFQTDWPIPTARPRPDETWTWNYNPTYMQSGAKPFAQTDWPTPPPAFQFRRNWEWNYNPGQLNTGAKPLFQFDWQLPIAQPRPDVNWTWPTFGGYFPVVSAIPFAQYDWPLPTRSPLLVYGGNHPRLYGPGIQPFNQLDWPVPTPRFRPTSNWDWSTPALAFPFAFPHNQYDWPLPGSYPRPDETWVSFYNPTQMQTGAKPFFPIEWPLPVPRFRIDATWAWPTPQGYFPAAVAYPFNQYDWPLPGRAPRPMFGSFYDRGLTATPFPFNQYDWPLPTLPFRMDATWIWQMQHFAAALPFNQYDWPLPVIQPQFFPYEFFANFVLGTPGNQPFAQYDWPLPRAPFRIEQTGAQFYNPSQMQTGTKPFAQTDWPVPLGARDPRQPDRTVAAFYNPTQMATGRKPFAQTEWPLPTPPNYGNLIHYTITGANNPNIYIPTPPSTVKIEWLIRARRRGRR